MTAASAFDQLADHYDRSFTERPPAQWLRQAVRERLRPLLPASPRVLEIGCGTGVDAVWLAQQGCRVWATDNSPRMLQQAGKRVAASDLKERIHLRLLDASHWQAGDSLAGQPVDLVFSNFGALNCVPDMAGFGHAAGSVLETGGHLAVCLMGPFCLWESLYFGLRGDLAKARRRWSGVAEYQIGGASQMIWYHAPASIEAAAVGFDRVGLYGIGGLLPTSEGFAAVEGRPRLLRVLARMDRRLAPYLFRISDHYLLIMRKRSP